eukprot:2033261-Prymnesium_polylepis.1
MSELDRFCHCGACFDVGPGRDPVLDVERDCPPRRRRRRIRRPAGRCYPTAARVGRRPWSTRPHTTQGEGSAQAG